MDDRELEARLRSRLHDRFDAGRPAPELSSAVAQLFATQPRRLEWIGVGRRRVQLGWSVAALAAVATIAILAANLRVTLGPGSVHSASPTAVAGPTATMQAPQRRFVVLPRAVDDQTAADEGLAEGLLGARLMALGFSTISAYSSEGTFLIFYVPTDGPSDAEIREILLAPGDVAFVPLPPADYGDGPLVAEPGKPLPKAEPPLFGWEAIASAARRGTGPPTTVVTLKGEAVDAFAAYTTAHVGEHFAIVIDGIVAIVPVVTSPITGGEVEITGGGEDPALFTRASAIVVSGRLPDTWQDRSVPVTMSEDAAVEAARLAHPSGVVTTRDLDVVQDGGSLRPVWRIAFDSAFFLPDEVVTLDATTGQRLTGPGS